MMINTKLITFVLPIYIKRCCGEIDSLTIHSMKLKADFEN